MLAALISGSHTSGCPLVHPLLPFFGRVNMQSNAFTLCITCINTTLLNTLEKNMSTQHHINSLTSNNKTGLIKRNAAFPG